MANESNGNKKGEEVTEEEDTYPISWFRNYPPGIFDKVESDITNSSIQYISLTRLIAYLTCHDVLNYDLVADFFLTYRLFTSSDIIQELLFSRLSWAIIKNSASSSLEIYRDIAVRTFVVIRHWLLNFFSDDFLPSVQLRVKFIDNLNQLYGWDPVKRNEQFRRIIDQLRKCWIRNIALYWNIENDEDVELEKLELSPGGQFGSLNVTGNNSNIIELYQTPILPVVNEDVSNGSTHNNTTGYFIRGGIDVSNDVEVKTVNPPTPVKNVNETAAVKKAQSSKTLKAQSSFKNLKSLASKPSLKNLFNSKFFHTTATKKMDAGHRQTPQEAFENEVALINYDPAPADGGQIRIDILSARVIEELDRVLKRHSLINKTSKDWDETRESVFGRSSSDVTATNSFSTTEDDTEDENEDDDAASSLREPCLTSEGDNNSRISFRPPRRRLQKQQQDDANRISFIDNLDVRETNLSNEEEDNKSICSYESYDSEKSTCIQKETSLLTRDEELNKIPGALLKRREQFNNLRKAANVVYPQQLEPSTTTSGSSVNTGSSGFSMEATEVNLNNTGSVIFDPHNNGGGRPFSGVDERFAAELAAIPDDSSDDDAITSALEKLEGTYAKKKDNNGDKFRIPANTTNSSISRNLAVIGNSPAKMPPMDSDVDSSLYNDAFATNIPTPYDTDLENLNIPNGFERKSGSTITSTNNKNNNEFNETNDNEFNDVYDNNNNNEEHMPNAIRNLTKASTITNNNNNNHTPFILNYKSKVLSEQMTLIERDALAQVDWKELIELKWPGTNLDPVQNWVTFLSDRRNTRLGGVELIISRFNLVVNWVKSEILLTWSIQQRMETISRFIHIAYQCRQNLKNYATMMQIILALGSPIIQKLKTTWSKISSLDLKMFQQMEELILPMGNFANLRKELNDAMGSFSNNGCIPFVGMYLSDLTFTGEQPSKVDGDEGEELINFKKCVTSAGIVKSLIQCIQWSEKYSIETNQNILSKCLYLHSLTIEEMEECFLYLSDN